MTHGFHCPRVQAIKQKTDAFWQRAAATAVAIDLTVAFAPTVLNLIQQ